MTDIPETVPDAAPFHEAIKTILEWAATGVVDALAAYDFDAHAEVWMNPENLSSDAEDLHAAFEVAWSKHAAEVPTRESCWQMMRDFIEALSKESQ